MLYLLLRPIIKFSISDTRKIFWHIFAQNFKLGILAQSSWSSYQLPLFHLATECISSLLSPKVNSYDSAYNCQQKYVHLTNQDMILTGLFTGI